MLEQISESIIVGQHQLHLFHWTLTTWLRSHGRSYHPSASTTRKEASNDKKVGREKHNVSSLKPLTTKIMLVVVRRYWSRR